MTNCYRCGAPAELLVDDDASAVCGPCENDYQAWLDAQYPFGQCQTCGASYRQDVCEQGVTHVSAPHVEGACGNWSDAEPPSPVEVALGACYYGCRVQSLAWFSYNAATEAAEMLAYDRETVALAAEYARMKAYDDDWAREQAEFASGMYRSYMQSLSDRLDEMNTRGRYGRPDFTPDFGGIQLRRDEERYAAQETDDDLPF